MPVQRQLEVDLKSEEVCDFLKNHTQTEYDYSYDKQTWEVEDNYYNSNELLEFPRSR